MTTEKKEGVQGQAREFPSLAFPVVKRPRTGSTLSSTARARRASHSIRKLLHRLVGSDNAVSRADRLLGLAGQEFQAATAGFNG